ncbi:MAG TPA: septum formation inhibitor Maf [Syntrophothermus lipocalidus]|uniref:dTTP/UTP pyrophosphatase n=1 Tax=Syntrophothermus lipocalidus (strain DSM 12680 / TGB-C1) TaxID=643648 RepID=D7CL84_SYNLT|nr:Maf family protein [Syntrophothermus lipocalidus]ADI01469.1 maf protein [Syntrophothermus lipocalidus DSM 12680]HHV76491.1 septum formation inhibitor Maf [Syntrophothermus lipocalidus]HOV43257.1 Maf family protein [Syntrophothermus lipocalidus]
MKRIVLASESPRRYHLLKNLGLEFEVQAPKIVENIKEGLKPDQQAVELARAKAWSIARRLHSGVVVGADTVVVIGESILGKPCDRNHAIEMLALLSGKRHQVITGICVIDCESGLSLEGAETTEVYFRYLSREEILVYVDSGEPYDKAGGYGIQGLGALLVDRIEGCYYNVVGLPVARLYCMLKQVGIDILARGWEHGIGLPRNY